MVFEYEIKGVKLNMDDMVKIDHYYHVAGIAEFILENYQDIEEDYVWDLAGDAVYRIEKYFDDELDAIEEVCQRYYDQRDALYD